MKIPNIIHQTRSAMKCLALAGAALLAGNAQAAPPVAGYARWFDASTLGLADNAAVANWPDGSTNAAHATVPSGNRTPVYIANAGTETGLGAVYLDGGGGANGLASCGSGAESRLPMAAPTVMRGLDPIGATGGAPWWRRRYDSSSDNEKAIGIIAGIPGGLTLKPAPTKMRGLDPRGATGGAKSSRRRGNCGIVMIFDVR
jgi:hypothetical protein